MDISYCLERLDNWRRAYSDRLNRNVSITYVFCKYLEETTERAKETEEERKAREEEELENREPIPPPIDFKDAALLNDVWQSMPDRIEHKPIKKNIKVLVFGTSRQLDNILRKAGIRRGKEFIEWRDKAFRIFFERVEREEELRREIPYLPDDKKQC